MKFVYNKLLSAITLIAVILSGIVSSTGQEMPKVKNYSPAGDLKYIMPDLTPVQRKINLDRTQAGDIEFISIDSMSNAYSYIDLMANKSFVYDRSSGNLLTAKRGYYNKFTHPKLNPADFGNNKSGNLFLLSSSDMGNTWSTQQTIFDSSVINFEGRYPSIYGFSKESKQYVAYAAPLIDYSPTATSTEWAMLFFGIWNQDITDIFDIPIGGTHNEGLIINNIEFDWDATSRIIAGFQKDDPDNYYFVNAGPISPDDTSDHGNASHLALLKTNDLTGDLIPEIPDAWNSNNYKPITSGGSIISEIIDLQQAESGTLYMAAYAGFLNEAENTVGVSKSNDYGQTWENYNIMPSNLMSDYATKAGRDPSHVVLGRMPIGFRSSWGWSVKGFVSFDNGDYSIVTLLLMYDVDAQNYVINSKYDFVECYYENNIWGIRKIGDLEGTFLRYMDHKSYDKDAADSVRLNTNDFEMQVARTIDGSALIAKWINITGFDTTNNTFKSSDVFIATRAKNQLKWGPTQNITNSDDLDRLVYLPDYVPNDLQNIPLLRIYATKANNLSEFESQFYVQRDQYVQIGHFSTVVGIEDETNNDNSIKFDVIPNPVNDKGYINIYYEGKPVQSEIAIYDMLGRKITVINNGMLNYGSSQFPFNTNGLSSGVYYCTISLNSKKITRMINIIK